VQGTGKGDGKKCCGERDHTERNKKKTQEEKGRRRLKIGEVEHSSIRVSGGGRLARKSRRTKDSRSIGSDHS